MTAYLAGDRAAAVTAAQREQLDAIRIVLTDPAVWAQPDPRLAERTVAEIATELRSGPPHPDGPR